MGGINLADLSFKKVVLTLSAEEVLHRMQATASTRNGPVNVMPLIVTSLGRLAKASLAFCKYPWNHDVVLMDYPCERSPRDGTHRV